MSSGRIGWRDGITIARAILHDRAARRRLMGRLLLAALLMLAAGLWLVDGWLAGNLWLFLGWWACCAGLTLLVMLFALYDALAVIREEREKHK